MILCRFEDGDEDTHYGASRRRGGESLQIFAGLDVTRDRRR